jgi:hypothetical protein
MKRSSLPKNSRAVRAFGHRFAGFVHHKRVLFATGFST